MYHYKIHLKYFWKTNQPTYAEKFVVLPQPYSAEAETKITTEPVLVELQESLAYISVIKIEFLGQSNAIISPNPESITTGIYPPANLRSPLVPTSPNRQTKFKS